MKRPPRPATTDPDPTMTSLLRLTSTALILGASAIAAPARAQGAMELVVNIPAGRLDVMQGGERVRSYPVSVGRARYATPTGATGLRRMVWNPTWTPPPGAAWARGEKKTGPGWSNPMGRVKIHLFGDYYVHGTPAGNERYLGSPASHGCIRMRNRDVIALARLLHEHAQPTVAPAEIDAILRRSGTTRWSTFRAPVPLVIRYEPVVIENGELTVYPDVYERSRIHTEGVIQALLAAGYEARSIDRGQVRDVLRRAGQAGGTFTVKVADAFDGLERRADIAAN